MERILGLLDTLESMICDSPKVPFTGKALVSEGDLLAIIDKIRLVAQSGDKHLVRGARRELEAPAHPRAMEAAEQQKTLQMSEDPEAKAVQIIQQAYQIAREIRTGADKYADEVLSNLEATTDRIIRTVKNGRLRLSKATPDASALLSATKDFSSLEGDVSLLLKQEQDAAILHKQESKTGRAAN